MRILHLPCNVASQISDTVMGMRNLNVEVRGLCNANLITSSDDVEIIPVIDKSSLIRRYNTYKLFKSYILDAIDWADVVHWYCGRALPGAYDVKYARSKKKKMVIEFAGSDIRIPEIESIDNPYYAETFKDGLWEYKNESRCRSRRHQQLFAKNGAALILPYRALDCYIFPELFPKTLKTMHRLHIEKYIPDYPSLPQDKPLIIHSPSKINAKGTPTVLAIIEELKRKYDFNFQLIHNMSYYEASSIMQKCDIFLDQFVLGAHGVAALEAMAYGKPVICYLKPSLITEYPADLPIINANKDNLADKLIMLIQDAETRNHLGRKGRCYVEKYHDSVMLSRDLLTFYESL